MLVHTKPMYCTQCKRTVRMEGGGQPYVTSGECPILTGTSPSRLLLTFSRLNPYPPTLLTKSIHTHTHTHTVTMPPVESPSSFDVTILGAGLYPVPTRAIGANNRLRPHRNHCSTALPSSSSRDTTGHSRARLLRRGSMERAYEL